MKKFNSFSRPSNYFLKHYGFWYAFFNASMCYYFSAWMLWFYRFMLPTPMFLHRRARGENMISISNDSYLQWSISPMIHISNDPYLQWSISHMILIYYGEFVKMTSIVNGKYVKWINCKNVWWIVSMNSIGNGIWNESYCPWQVCLKIGLLNDDLHLKDRHLQWVMVPIAIIAFILIFSHLYSHRYIQQQTPTSTQPEVFWNQFWRNIQLRRAT